MHRHETGPRRGGQRISPGFEVLPTATEFFAVCNQLFKVNIACCGQRDVGWRVTALEVLMHPIRSQTGHGLFRSQNALAQRMITKVLGHDTFVTAIGRLVVVHLDFFDDHLLFGFEIIFTQRRTHDIRKHLDHLALEVRQNGGVINRALLTSPRIRMRTDLVEFAIHVFRRTVRRALENHVLQKMTDATDLRRLVACSGAYKEATRHCMSSRITLGNNLQAVSQLMLTVLHDLTPEVQDPK